VNEKYTDDELHRAKQIITQDMKREAQRLHHDKQQPLIEDATPTAGGHKARNGRF
jgi:hypothetical protein